MSKSQAVAVLLVVYVLAAWAAKPGVELQVLSQLFLVPSMGRLARL